MFIFVLGFAFFTFSLLFSKRGLVCNAGWLGGWWEGDLFWFSSWLRCGVHKSIDCEVKLFADDCCTEGKV